MRLKNRRPNGARVHVPVFHSVPQKHNLVHWGPAGGEVAFVQNSLIPVSAIILTAHLYTVSGAVRPAGAVASFGRDGGCRPQTPDPASLKGGWLTDFQTGVIALGGRSQTTALLFYQLGQRDVPCPWLAATNQGANLL